jgi:CubicO group peptidase (beta-lactamase class C family)
MSDEFDDEGPVGMAVRWPGGGRAVGAVNRARPVFSVTKMFVATAAVKLAESGRLELDAAISDHVPAAPADLTLREALGHTGGLPDYATAADYRAAVEARPGQPWGLDAILDVGLREPRAGRGRFRYSNLGYWLAGAVLEAVAHTSLTELLSGLVFRPAGMVSTTYPAVGTGVTTGGYDTRWAGPAGAAWSTPADLLAFLAALFDGALVSPQSLATMSEANPVDADEGPWRRPGYGLGVMIDDGTDGAGAGIRTVGHGGAGPGHRSAAFITPATGRSAAVTVQDPSTVDPVEVALRLVRP